jgi:hypothetical protein
MQVAEMLMHNYAYIHLKLRSYCSMSAHSLICCSRNDGIQVSKNVTIVNTNRGNLHKWKYRDYSDYRFVHFKSKPIN